MSITFPSGILFRKFLLDFFHYQSLSRSLHHQNSKLFLHLYQLITYNQRMNNSIGKRLGRREKIHSIGKRMARMENIHFCPKKTSEEIYRVESGDS